MRQQIIPDKAMEQHAIALGKTRSGKSSAMRVLVERQLDQGKRVCIIDPKGDWYGLRVSANGKSPGYPVVIFGGEHADVPLNQHAGAQVAELVATGNRPCIIDLGGWHVAERTRFYIDFAATLFRTSKAPMHLVIDEVHNFAPQGKVMDPDAGKMIHWSNRLASEGQGKGIILLAASQRPQKVHKDFVTSCETLLAFRVIHPLDRNAIKDWIDGCPDREKGREVLESLATMQRGEAWAWSPEIGFGPVRVKFPMFSTFDSFAAPSGGDIPKLKGWAEIDLAEVTAKLQTVVDEAKANDPRELRKQIIDLKKQLATRPKEQVEKTVEKIVEIPVLKNGQLTRTEKHAAKVQELADRFLAESAELRRLIAPAAAPRPAPVRPSAPRVPTPRTIHPPTQRLAATDESLKLGGSQQRILNALAWLESIGLPEADKTQVALLADQSPTSGGYFNNLGKLRTAGLIDYPRSSVIALTEAGRAQAELVNVPQTSEELHIQICARLTNSQARILREVIARYPDDVDKGELAEATDQSPTSGGYFNNLGRLRSLGLIDYPSPGRVVACSILFLEGATA